MKKHLQKIVVGILSCSLLLSGCTNNTAPASSSVASIPEQQTVTVVTSGGGLPYSLLEGDDEWSGLEADMWQSIGERTGWDIQVKRASFDAIFGELDSGRADVAANCFAEKEERAEKYYMSTPFYGDAQCLALNENNTDIQSFEDLKGKKVGVTSGQASQTILEEMAAEYDFELIVYESLNIGYSDVALGRIDAMGGPVTGVNQFNNANTDKVKIMDTKLRANNVVYYFPKTEAGEKLCNKVNAVIEEMNADGTTGKITEKWLFEDMTSYIQ